VELILLHQVESFNTFAKTLKHKGPHSIHPLLQSSANLHQIYKTGLNQQFKSIYILYHKVPRRKGWNTKDEEVRA